MPNSDCWILIYDNINYIAAVIALYALKRMFIFIRDFSDTNISMAYWKSVITD